MTAGRGHLALAADLPLDQALALYRRVSPSVACAKVGLSLFVEHGPSVVAQFQKLGAEVFLDLKLHDIPNTVELAAARAGSLGVKYLTVHAQGGEAMLRAAVMGARAGAASAGFPAPAVLAVTVLTSLNDADLAAQGLVVTASAQALRLASLAMAAGVQGLVCSAQEVAQVRALVGRGPLLCTPGIRPKGSLAFDQARVEGPAEAIVAGSDLLVVGRPIYEAADPDAAARALEQAVASALKKGTGYFSDP